MFDQRPWYSRLSKRSGYCMSTSFNIKKIYILPTQCISAYFLYATSNKERISRYAEFSD